MSLYMFLCQQKSEENIGSPETGVAASPGQHCKCWELNLGHLQEQQLLLTTELSLQIHLYIFSKSSQSSIRKQYISLKIIMK